jgi:hypothetical protein
MKKKLKLALQFSTSLLILLKKKKRAVEWVPRLRVSALAVDC